MFLVERCRWRSAERMAAIVTEEKSVQDIKEEKSERLVTMVGNNVVEVDGS